MADRRRLRRRRSRSGSRAARAAASRGGASRACSWAVWVRTGIEVVALTGCGARRGHRAARLLRRLVRRDRLAASAAVCRRGARACPGHRAAAAGVDRAAAVVAATHCAWSPALLALGIAARRGWFATAAGVPTPGDQLAHTWSAARPKPSAPPSAIRCTRRIAAPIWRSSSACWSARVCTSRRCTKRRRRSTSIPRS